MKLYWVSIIIQDVDDKKPWLCAMSEAKLSLDEAMRIIVNARENHIVLSAWVDVFNEDNNKQTVFHECYINALGNVME